MDIDRRYTLADLARVTGVTPRTVRYYIAQGLLPGANETGPGASYGANHLARLRLIRELQREHLPLAEIRSRLGTLSDAEVAEVSELAASYPIADAEPAESALDYIRGLLGSKPGKRRPGEDELISYPPTPPKATFAGGAHGLQMRAMRSDAEDVAAGWAALDDPGASPALRRRALGAPAAAPVTPPPTEAPTPSRSQWDRIALTNDIELHVRRPLSRLDNRRVERLITIARQVLGEEKP